MLKDIKMLFAQNKIDEAFISLFKILENQDNVKYNEAILLSSQYKNLKRENRTGIVNRAELNSEIAKIIYSSLSLIDEINQGSKLKKNSSKNFELVVNSNEFIYAKINNIEESMRFHTKEVKNWSQLIKFRDSSQSKILSKVYVDLDYFIIPRRLHFGAIEENKSLKLKEILENEQNHLVILGQAGAGKTTTMKKLVLDVLNKNSNYDFPIVVRLRELNDKKTSNIYLGELMSYIVKIIGINISVEIPTVNSLSRKEKHEYISRSRKKQLKNEIKYIVEYNRLYLNKTIISLIDNLKILLILDGYDELNEFKKQDILKEIEILALNLNNSKLILTSRTAEYAKTINNITEYEICPLNDTQIKIFINQWINNPEQSAQLYSQLINSPFNDTAIRPLTLAHLCALFERYLKIPEKPKSIYRKIVNLLLEEWDNQRSISRKSIYSKFQIDVKFDFLTYFAYVLTTTYEKSTFSPTEMESAYKKICSNFGLPINESKEVINELETHTGIFLQAGYEKFEFAHKSIQEYLTAEYIVRLPFLLDSVNVTNIPSELALATAISSNPSLYFANIIFNKSTTWINSDNLSNFINQFFNRLILEKPDFQSQYQMQISILFVYTISEMKNKQIDIDRLIEKFKYDFSMYDILKNYDLVKNPDYNNIYANNSLKFIYSAQSSELIDTLYKKKIGKNNVLLKRAMNIEDSYLFEPPTYVLAKREWLFDNE